MRRLLSRIFEGVNARPIGILVFAGSVTLLVFLQSSELGRFRVRAVAEARGVDHPAAVASFVERVYVRPGDVVEPGMPLLEISPRFIARELALLDAEAEEIQREAALARTRLAMEEERWLPEEFRQRPNGPSSLRPTEALFAAQMARVQTRREQLRADYDLLAVKSVSRGRVAFVLREGASVAVGTSVATVVPEFADEIVAYVPAETDPALIAPGALAKLLDSQLVECMSDGRVTRRGYGVVAAPPQLQGLFRMPVHGMPVYISTPPGCGLGVGQVLTVEFPKAGG
jgi:multidrug efflux pump subunit AcrA (membrane-fusion protein)